MDRRDRRRGDRLGPPQFGHDPQNVLREQRSDPAPRHRHDKEIERPPRTIGEHERLKAGTKKIVRKLATTMYKHSYSSLQEENRHFEILYEMVIEGRLRDDKPVILTADQALDVEITNLVQPDDDATDSEIEEAE